MGRVKGGGEREEKTLYFFYPLPSPSPVSFFRPRTYRKGYYFYSPQSSTVIKSKMVATTILRTRSRFRPPKIRLHCFLRLSLCAAYVFRVTWPKRLCLAIPHRNALTEIAWEDAVQGLVNCRYKAASNRSALLQTSSTTESDVGPLY